MKNVFKANFYSAHSNGFNLKLENMLNRKKVVYLLIVQEPDWGVLLENLGQ